MTALPQNFVLSEITIFGNHSPCLEEENLASKNVKIDLSQHDFKRFHFTYRKQFSFSFRRIMAYLEKIFVQINRRKIIFVSRLQRKVENIFYITAGEAGW